MMLSLPYQGFIILIFCTVIQCENKEQNVKIEKDEYSKNSHHVLQNGQIISKPISYPIPVDQIVPSKNFQHDDNNQNKPKYIARGDILIPIEEIELANSKRSKRKIIAETNQFGSSNRWPRGVVPYQFLSGIDSRVQQNVLTAIQHWHQRTCIRFEPYDPQRHWDIAAKIIIEDTGSGCATFVGYRPASSGDVSSYSVYLPLECPLGSAIHELGHVIGYYHEMARTDRDLEINLYFNLMSSSEATQYDIMPNPMPGYYGQPYDLGSIMHYYGTDVMTARDSRRTFLMGQRVALSFLDTKLANLGYHCGDSCDPQPTCQNEGYVNQYCKCTCPDGFYGDQCNLLQGYSVSTRLLPPDSQPSITVDSDGAKITLSSTMKPTPQIPTSKNVKWLEWSSWSNCSESCGGGVRVRTRLCSNTAIGGSANPCSSLGGDSFEMEACQNSGCKQHDIIMSCTFDLDNEICPRKNATTERIQHGMQADKTRPISDHTRGDGKYIIITGNTTRSDDSEKFQLGPFTRSNSSNEENHCLQYWYSIRGEGIGSLVFIHNGTNDSFTFKWKDQNTNWKKIQRTIPNVDNSELVFTFQSISPEFNQMAIDDISITNGACESKTSINQRRRKRRQANTDCTQIIDLSTNTIASITSPNYPNLYPANSVCYYYIRAPQNSHVVLQFTDFNVPTYNTDNCDDTLEIRYYHLGQPGPKYCGTGANSNNLRFVSIKNYIMVVFRSDQSYAGRGFRAQAAVAQ